MTLERRQGRTNRPLTREAGAISPPSSSQVSGTSPRIPVAERPILLLDYKPLSSGLSLISGITSFQFTSPSPSNAFGLDVEWSLYVNG